MLVVIFLSGIKFDVCHLSSLRLFGRQSLQFSLPLPLSLSLSRSRSLSLSLLSLSLSLLSLSLTLSLSLPPPLPPSENVLALDRDGEDGCGLDRLAGLPPELLLLQYKLTI